MKDPTGFRNYQLLQTLPPAELEAFSKELNTMNEAEITLYLARAGISPLDVEASLERCMDMIADYLIEEMKR